ncbi:MAG: HD domain-containing protein [Thermodesulfobacteriota bacterium]|nr:HD domain-containing protein [Thermodesulfobacteriota bacterium]
METAKTYRGKALIADPIYQYIWFTVPSSDLTSEKTEKDLIDSPWLQRLRRIYQLQSARWVYPSAEHTRFQHSLGTMHMAGEFVRHLYPGLKETFPEIPSINFIEELLRVGGLLHDVGHGPYGHFFDDHFLSQYGLTHEILGQKIITEKLGHLIKDVGRSPSGNFEDGECLDPEQIAFLIKKPDAEREEQPGWLVFLRQLFSGVYTVDNLDYVQRDAYMTGFSIDIVDMQRLRFYTFFTEKGLTLHQVGVSALGRFLNARLSLYSNVYFHRTTRALDLHLQEIFRDTMDIIFPCDPADNLGEYLNCDDWSLYNEVKGWLHSEDAKTKSLGEQWGRLHGRQVKWKMSHSAELFVNKIQRGISFSSAKEYEGRIRAALPAELRDIVFRVDLATQAPRPIDLIAEGDKKINIFNPSTETISLEPIKDIYRFIPARVTHFRVFSLDHRHDKALTVASEKVLGSIGEVVTTNL